MLTVVSVSDFFARKPYAVANQSITDKYANLVKTYACFNDADPQPTPPHVLAAQAIHKQQNKLKPQQHQCRPTHHNHRGGRRPYPPLQVVTTPPPFLTPHKDKDPIRIIMGLLNVINTDNYSKIFQKLRLLIDYSNIAKVIEAILEKCCIATIFVTVYIKLIEDIGTLYKLNGVVIDWAKQASTKILYMPVATASSAQTSASDEYDEFCRMQKHKLYVAGLNTTMIKLAKAPLISLDILKSYTEFILKNILDYSTEHNLDICLNCMIEMRKAYKDALSPGDINAIKSNIDTTTVPHRIRFLLQELTA